MNIDNDKITNYLVYFKNNNELTKSNPSHYLQPNQVLKLLPTLSQQCCVTTTIMPLPAGQTTTAPMPSARALPPLVTPTLPPKTPTPLLLETPILMLLLLLEPPLGPPTMLLARNRQRCHWNRQRCHWNYQDCRRNHYYYYKYC